MIFLFLKPSLALPEAELARLKIDKILATFENSISCQFLDGASSVSRRDREVPKKRKIIKILPPKL